jgi:hypothetical protein
MKNYSPSRATATFKCKQLLVASQHCGFAALCSGKQERQAGLPLHGSAVGTHTREGDWPEASSTASERIRSRSCRASCLVWSALGRSFCWFLRAVFAPCHRTDRFGKHAWQRATVRAQRHGHLHAAAAMAVLCLSNLLSFVTHLNPATFVFSQSPLGSVASCMHAAAEAE